MKFNYFKYFTLIILLNILIALFNIKTSFGVSILIIALANFMSLEAKE